MKSISVFLAAIFLFVGCKSGSEEKIEPNTNESPASTETSTQTNFSPYMAMWISHRVENFDKWLKVFDAHDTARKRNGLTVLTLGRDVEDSNIVYVRLRADDKQKAMDFFASDDTKEAMKRSGVSSPPMIIYMNVIRDDQPNTDLKQRVIVSHHVKDFDVWLKAFDDKGKQTRAANALIDRTIARDMADPNMVYIVFDVIDLEKARARIFSPEVKKFMADAGVDSPPVVHFYKLVN